MPKMQLPLSLILLLILAMACQILPTPPLPPATSTVANTPTPTPEPPMPTPEPATPTPTPLPPSPTPTVPPSTDELAQLLMEQLYPDATPEPDSFSGIEGVNVIPLDIRAGHSPLWAAFSYGMRDFMAEQMHFVAIYAYDGRWQELSRIEMDDVDYVADSSVQQVLLEPERIWLELHAGVGAHSGTFHLMRFDNEKLQIALSGFNSSPDAGQTTDLNNDGLLEVILNFTDPYVFCYACGVRLPMFQVWRWDGEQLVEVSLTSLPDSTPTELREANNQAVALAEGWLWQEAQTAIAQALALDPSNETMIWNDILITMHTEPLAEQIEFESGYPLLANIFYGDYAAALNLMRPYPVAEIFSPTSPLIVDTVAAGWEPTLHDWISQATDAALVVQPDLAAAYFLRAWALYLVNPDDPQILANLERAIGFDPTEPLYAESLAYLSR